MYHLGASSAAASDSLQIGRQRFIDRSLHLDFQVLQRSKMVDFLG